MLIEIKDTSGVTRYINPELIEQIIPDTTLDSFQVVMTSTPAFTIDRPTFFYIREFKFYGLAIIPFDTEQYNLAVLSANGKSSFQSSYTDEFVVKEANIQVLVGEKHIINAIGDNITYLSNDPSIATVDANGVITTVAKGMTSIVAEKNGESVLINVTVVDMKKPNPTFTAPISPVSRSNFTVGYADTNGFTLTKDDLVITSTNPDAKLDLISISSSGIVINTSMKNTITVTCVHNQASIVIEVGQSIHLDINVITKPNADNTYDIQSILYVGADGIGGTGPVTLTSSDPTGIIVSREIESEVFNVALNKKGTHTLTFTYAHITEVITVIVKGFPTVTSTVTNIPVVNIGTTFTLPYSLVDNGPSDVIGVLFGEGIVGTYNITSPTTIDITITEIYKKSFIALSYYNSRHNISVEYTPVDPSVIKYDLKIKNGKLVASADDPADLPNFETKVTNDNHLAYSDPEGDNPPIIVRDGNLIFRK